MLKIAVFGIGRGGEAVAKYLSTELNTVEIIEVIDWSNLDGTYRDQKEMYCAACYFLTPYIGKVDLVVLADYTMSLVKHSLKMLWPEQEIIGMGFDFRHIPKSCQNTKVVTLLANELLFQSDLGKNICRQLSCADIILPDCSGWEELIDAGDMSEDILELELGKSFALANNYDSSSRLSRQVAEQKTSVRAEIIKFLLRTDSSLQSRPAMLGAGYANEIDYESYADLSDHIEVQPPNEVWSAGVIYVLNTHFWTIESDLCELFGYNASVMDFRRKLLHDVCLALGLRGVDGRLGE